MAKNRIFFDFGGRCMIRETDNGRESGYAWMFKDQVVEFVPPEAWDAFRACAVCGFDFEEKKFYICSAEEPAGEKTAFDVTDVYDAPRLNYDYFTRSFGIDVGTSECFKNPEIERAEERQASYGGPAPEELAEYLPKNMACNLAAAVVNQLLYAESEILGSDYNEDIKEVTEALYAAHTAYRDDIEPEKSEVLAAVLAELTELASGTDETSDDAQSILELIAVYTGLQQSEVEEYLF